MEEVLEEVDQYLISQYAELRRQTIANFIVNQPIFGYCEGGGEVWIPPLPILVGAIN